MKSWKALVLLALTAALIAVSAPARSGPVTAMGDVNVESPDAGGFVGFFSSLALDASGYPVVSYHDMTNGNLKVLHCNDPNCSGDDESTAAPDTSGAVGEYTSLALDVNGYPVASYWDMGNGDLKVLHCNDPNCLDGDESITSPDADGVVGRHTSLALDAGGHPVVSYWDVANADLKVLHCNDPNCTGGDESITSPDTEGTVGCFSSLALDASGYPVVSYRDGGNGDLKVLHCNDPNCSGGDESIASPDTVGDVGMFTSLVLDISGYPVVSYCDATNEDLKLLHCRDAECISTNVLTSPHTSGSVGRETSLALDGAGSPVVSYRDATSFDLWVLHCGDPTCTKGTSPLPSPTPGPNPGLGGEVNCDGRANSVDAALALQFDAALVGSLPCQDAADVRNDGVVNSIDAALILQLEAGLIPGLPP